jgi:hypothetical protein
VTDTPYVVAKQTDYVTLTFGGGITGMWVYAGHRYLSGEAAVKQRPDLFRPAEPVTAVAA